VQGAGPIGLELGQFFARIGTEVVVVNRSPVLWRCDRDAGAELTRALAAEPRIHFEVPATIERLRRAGDGLVATLHTESGEREVEADGADVAFPGWEALRDEDRESDPVVLLIVRDADGQAVRTLPAARTAGLHRTTWDLRLPPPDPVDLDGPAFRPPWVSDPVGPLAPAGSYSVELVRAVDGGAEVLAGPQPFTVRDVPAVEAELADGEVTAAELDAFRRSTADLARRVEGTVRHIDELRRRIRHLRAGIGATPGAGPDLLGSLERLHHRP